MCETCGCDDATHVTAVNLQTRVSIALGDAAPPGLRHHSHEHVHADGTRHTHEHLGPHHHDAREPQGAAAVTVDLDARVLAKNEALAERNRGWLAARQVFAVNLMGAPGAGKTALLERTIREIGETTEFFVVEGDQATLNDGDRIRAAGAPVVQVNTGTGCHLDAGMVAHGLAELQPPDGSVVIVENVGNLVCPALFDLGEGRRVVVLSATEGEDKPLKYPHMFRAADLVLLNKVDLLPYIDFDMEAMARSAHSVNPDVVILSVSAKTGEGMAQWYDWLWHQRSPGDATNAP